MPELWEKSRFHVKGKMLKALCGISIVVNSGSVLLLTFTKSRNEILMNLVMLGIALFFALLRKNKVTIKASYEAM